MFQIGDRVKVGKPIGTSGRLVNIDNPLFGTVVDVIPGHRDGNDVYREDMYRIRFEGETTAPTLTPTPNESWIDGWLVIRPNDWE
jgi:hypothetical protein